ncbi:MAG: (4Fe-4S)-binding protein [Ignavibacteria bacterium]|nr:(4Fe-4S)-binding protein [Ignavibacteria bacterium]
MSERKKTYSSDDITVIWKPDVCIHSTKCWKASLSVFNPKRRPWIDINAGTTDEIIKIVDNCPSGALSYERNKKMSEQKAQPAQSQQSQTTVQVNKGGPYLVKGKFVFVSTDGKEEIKEGSVALCRCGASNNKPFCDGGHSKIGFDQG